MALTLNSLTKSYGAARALSGVSFALAPGERVALLGHNGAGKSTLMKIALGLIPFDGGTVQVLGAAPGQNRQGVAYLPENVAFHPALTGEEQIALFLSLRGEAPNGARDLLARVGLHDAATRRIGTYSKGMRQRVGLAQALIGQPRLLILDEPTSGLDPVARGDFYALLDGLSATGAAILLSSHALSEVEDRTDRIVILSGGHLVADGALDQLSRDAGLPVRLVVTAAPGQGAAVAHALTGSSLTGASLTGSSLKGDCVTVPVPAAAKLAALAQIIALGQMVADVDVQTPSLDAIYAHFSKRDGQ